MLTSHTIHDAIYSSTPLCRHRCKRGVRAIAICRQVENPPCDKGGMHLRQESVPFWYQPWPIPRTHQVQLQTDSRHKMGPTQKNYSTVGQNRKCSAKTTSLGALHRRLMRHCTRVARHPRIYNAGTQGRTIETLETTSHPQRQTK